MHINIYNSIKVYFLDSELINTIEDAKKETADKNTSSHLDTHIKKVLKEQDDLLAISAPHIHQIRDNHKQKTHTTTQG